MEFVQGQLNIHCFICTHFRESGECCATKEAPLLRSQLRQYFKDKNIPIKISESGCLGDCQEGIAAVIYPKGLKIKNLKLSEQKELQNLLQKLI